MKLRVLTVPSRKIVLKNISFIEGRMSDKNAIQKLKAAVEKPVRTHLKFTKTRMFDPINRWMLVRWDATNY